MFRAIVTGERLDQGGFGGLDSMIAVSGQHGGIAFAGKDGLHDGGAGLTGDVSEHVMDLEIHLIERLVNVLDMPAALAHERVAMAPERAHAAHLGRRTESRAQQTNGVEVLQPLAIHHVGLAAGHVLHVAGVDQADLDLYLFKHLGQRDPINTRRFHRDGLDPEGLQPGDERVQILGKGGEAAHRIGREGRRHGGVDLSGSDVGAGSMGVDYGLDGLDFGLALARHGSVGWWRRPQAAPCAPQSWHSLKRDATLAGRSPLTGASARAPR